MATTTTTGNTTLPEIFNSNNFWLEIDGMLEACFTECSGLEITTETMEYREGGLNSHTHKLPVRTSYSNLTLKRGMSSSTKLWDWYEQTIAGKPQQKSISVLIYSSDTRGTVGRRWEIDGAYPVKWSGPSLSATGNDITIESIELAYNFFKLVS